MARHTVARREPLRAALHAASGRGTEGQRALTYVVAKAVLDSFRAELRVCMGRAQTPVSLKDLLTDDADGDEDGEAMGRVVQRRDLVGNVDFAVHT